MIIFRSEQDARAVYAALPKRFACFGLELHPEKTRLIDFRQPPYRQKDRPEVSFDFLGFTHFWGSSQKGGWIVQRKTAQSSRTKSYEPCAFGVVVTSQHARTGRLQLPGSTRR